MLPAGFLKGFTLAELLIALAILGVIATFTIPKILSAQQDGRNNAIAKEDLAAFAQAFQQYQLSGSLTANTYPKDLTPYLNYVSVSTSGTIDDRPPNAGALTCTVAAPCLKMHNGSIIQPLSEYFNGTSSLNAVSFTIDPDGTYTGKADSLRILLYYNGKMTDRNNCLTGTLNSGTGCGPISNGNPTWFSW